MAGSTAALRRTSLRVLGILSAAGIGFLAAEAVIRLFALAPHLEEQYQEFVSTGTRPYARRPFSHVAGRNSTDEFDYDYRHNSLGFRGPEWSRPKPENVFRIVGLGDSFTYGVGVSLEETYLHRLETLLNQRSGPHPRVEVINLGMPAYFPEPERMVLEQIGATFRPDLILVGFLPNDVVDTYRTLGFVTVDRSGYLVTRDAARLGAVGATLYRHCHVCRIALRGYLSWKMERGRSGGISGIWGPAGMHERDWLAIEREYGRMHRIADSIGSTFVLMQIPQRPPWSPEARYPGQRLIRWATSRQVGFLDLLPVMEAAAGQRLYYPLDGHCTPAGHALIAEELARYLTARGMIP